MADFTFFTHPMSRGQIVRWALHEVNADYETVLIDWANKPQALLDANPLGKVPTLIHHHDGHDHIVTEAAAICHYLAEVHLDAGLLPTEHEKADYFRRMFFASGPIEHAITTKALNWKVPPEKTIMAGFGNYRIAVDSLEALLSDRDYVCGDRFTMADVYVGSQVDWGLQFGSLPERDTFAEYANSLRSRSNYREAKAIDIELIEQAQANG